MKKMIFIALLVSTTALQASDITLSKGISNQQRDKIERDLDVLENLPFKSPEVGTLKLMGLTELNAQTASQWLTTRVKYIIEESALSTFNLLIKNSFYVEREGVRFPNPGIIPYSTDPKNAKLFAKEKGIVVMSNIGAGLYVAGKSERKVLGIKVSRGTFKKGISVPVESPRVGIIQVGEALFMRRFAINNQNPDSIANSIGRLTTFFHEARHSDGNGLSLAFGHAPCPKGHDLEGAYACDESLNGAYAVEAAITKEMLKSCEETCTEKEKEILKITIIDAQSRVMKTTRKGTPVTFWDANPESL